MTIESISDRIAPVRKSIDVRRPLDQAFEIFTGRISAWWPKDRHSISGDRTREVVIEPRAKGAVFEIRDDGEKFPWGEVLEWEPPHRLVLSWHPGQDPKTGQVVEVRFTKIEDGTRVDLEHRDWHRRGDDARAVRNQYDGGWESVLAQHFKEACGR